MKHRFKALALAAALLALPPSPPARAEVAEVTLAQQFGAIFLPLMAMESEKLVEKHLAKQGLTSTKVTWMKLAGPAVMVDAMISGNLHFSSQGVPSMALMWDRTKANVGVKAISAVNHSQIYMNVRNPAINSIKDFTDKDRIALPSVKVSSQAIYLQIAAEKAFGAGQQFKLDHLTVALSHPDAITAMMNPQSEITAHFATSPFHEAEVKAGFKTITSSYEIMGGESSILVYVTTEKFRRENPKTFAAASAAMEEAIEWVNADKRRASKLYIEMTKEKKLTEDEFLAIISAKGFEYTRSPRKVGAFVAFMHKTGAIKTQPASWKDLFFEEAHGLPGD